ncbi:globin-like protein [Lipomyces oligophaga]|uniref:globin-like protein n=1 Tax=Lipomyces oligophaga TaxID=45792 RepID=UPI0034CF6BA5
MAGLTAEQILVIKSTVPVLEQYGNQITHGFYDGLFRDYPSSFEIFSVTDFKTDRQPRALAGAVVAVAKNIDNLGALSGAIATITNKHASLGVVPEQYDLVLDLLLKELREVLGDAWTSEIDDAWSTALRIVADALIATEKGLYQSTNGWTTWKELLVADKKQESDEVVSLYLKTIDGSALPPFKPGQYVSLQVKVPGQEYSSARQYSLSDKPSPDYYRISIRREIGQSDLTAPGSAPGVLSNFIHDSIKVGDKLKVSHPFGAFHLDSVSANTPLVFVGAGVGLTPLVSILNAVLESPQERQIHFIHGSRSASARPFADDLIALANSNPNLKLTFYESKDANQHPYENAKITVKSGHIDLKALSAEELFLGDKNTDYYVIGPTQFLAEKMEELKVLGVELDKIHSEAFGPGS